jgi:hypothetical protein
VEGARLWDINSVHRLIRKTENLRSLEPYNLARKFLLRSRHLTGLNEQLVLACVGEHVFELQIPGGRSNLCLLEELLLGLDVVNKHGFEVIDHHNLLLISRHIYTLNGSSLLN